ncbi:MAG: rRNA maturation RNase YbeY [Oligoflexia bacterium]|nr:rRNA maturation RNase YbeY [Oligoflexia bacterium]
MTRSKASAKSGPQLSLRKWQVQVSGYRSLPGLSSTQLKRTVLKLLRALEARHLPRTVNELSILFTDDRTIRKLNRTFRHKDKSTDVLSFSQLEGPGASSEVLGDIVISLPTARRQAKLRGVSTATEISELLAHGILHLFGYDHEKVPAREARRMFRKQEELMILLGLRPSP